MPKTTNISSSKKKKYNARFPPARIKKIMQTDEEVGKVAAAVPVIISRALEMFIESLITETAKLTRARNAKTLSTSHIKQTIKSTRQFDFLCDLVKNVPDHQTEESNGDSTHNGEYLVKKGKGRPRKSDSAGQRWKIRDGNKTSSDEDDEEEDDVVTEDTETDEESAHLQSQVVDRSKATGQFPTGLQPTQPYQVHGVLPPSMPDGTLNKDNNNRLPFIGVPPSSCLTVPHNSLASGQGMAQVLNAQNYSLCSSGDHLTGPSHLQQAKQPMYQIPFHSNVSSSLPQYVASADNLSYPSSVITPNSCQQHPIDLTNPLRQNIVKEDDDYDT